MFSLKNFDLYSFENRQLCEKIWGFLAQCIATMKYELTSVIDDVELRRQSFAEVNKSADDVLDIRETFLFSFQGVSFYLIASILIRQTNLYAKSKAGPSVPVAGTVISYLTLSILPCSLTHSNSFESNGKSIPLSTVKVQSSSTPADVSLEISQGLLKAINSVELHLFLNEHPVITSRTSDSDNYSSLLVNNAIKNSASEFLYSIAP